MHKEILGATEMAELFEVSKQTFNMRLRQKYWDSPWRKFPEPAYTVSAGRFWTWEQLEEFLTHPDIQRLYQGWRQKNEETEALKKLRERG